MLCPTVAVTYLLGTISALIHADSVINIKKASIRNLTADTYTIRGFPYITTAFIRHKFSLHNKTIFHVHKQQYKREASSRNDTVNKKDSSDNEGAVLAGDTKIIVIVVCCVVGVGLIFLALLCISLHRRRCVSEKYVF